MCKINKVSNAKIGIDAMEYRVLEQQFLENEESTSREKISELESNSVGNEQSVEKNVEGEVHGAEYEPSPESPPPYKYPWIGSTGQWAYYVLFGWQRGTYPPISEDYDYYSDDQRNKKANFDEPEWADELIAHQIYALGYTTPTWYQSEIQHKALMPMLDGNVRSRMFRLKHGSIADFIGRVLADIFNNSWLKNLI